MISFQDRISGGLIGLLIGDALGVPYEFHEPEDLPPRSELEFEPPDGFKRAHAGVKPGTWSDDGAQALCLLASLLHCQKLEPQDLGSRFISWYEHGYLAVDNHVFDVGIQSANAIQKLIRGVPALEAGGVGEYSQGNGSLMRVLPLALWHRGSDADLVQDAHDQSRVTHAHVIVQACCALYCLWARRTLERHINPWNAALESLRAVYATQPEYLDALETEILGKQHAPTRGTGYVMDCLFSAKWALEQGDFEAVVKAAISLGHDTDTTACVAGGIAGIRDGINAIPERWRSSLRGQNELEPLLKGLLEI